ncbi:aspartate-semialdehyde dehydrogenase [Phaffia rhodozyma]|uniref:Aspartate-semialdehyde dehydrogenase n=1 Tax=Phaffia rhodozyma TaxID=264483 RepID=A0A0F7SNT6_PHARH|nr:aspartate-semialdehyde dehydrogenase [Phaffia rhodozyma]
MSSSQQKIKVGILGATGTVGQRFITLLASHPFFEIHALGASPRSAGQAYPKATKWKQSVPIPEAVKQMTVRKCDPEDGFQECKIIFSGLDADAAGDIEQAFRKAEFAVFSNAKNYRQDPLVPLIVPTVNPSHIQVIPAQQASLSPPLQKGFIVTNANCSTTGLVVPLKALEDAFGPLDKCMVTTMQAISGGGYPGVPSMDILDNVVPYIGGEEEKIEWEASKILGGVLPEGKGFDLHSESPLKVSASCNRVAVLDGHTECVSVSFKNRPAPSPEAVAEAMRSYSCLTQSLGPSKVPSAAPTPLVVLEEQDRPQPRLDRNLHDGATVVVGRIRECPVLDIKFVCLSDNVRIGAATSSIINAELAVAQGVVSLE